MQATLLAPEPTRMGPPPPLPQAPVAALPFGRSRSVLRIAATCSLVIHLLLGAALGLRQPAEHPVSGQPARTAPTEIEVGAFADSPVADRAGALGAGPRATLPAAPEPAPPAPEPPLFPTNQ
mgnify:CR=1 FL=1